MAELDIQWLLGARLTKLECHMVEQQCSPRAGELPWVRVALYRKIVNLIVEGKVEESNTERRVEALSRERSAFDGLSFAEGAFMVSFCSSQHVQQVWTVRFM